MRWLLITLAALGTGGYFWMRHTNKKLVLQLADLADAVGHENLDAELDRLGINKEVVLPRMPAVIKELQRRESARVMERVKLEADLRRDFREAGMTAVEADGAVLAVRTRTLRVVS